MYTLVSPTRQTKGMHTLPLKPPLTSQSSTLANTNISILEVRGNPEEYRQLDIVIQGVSWLPGDWFGSNKSVVLSKFVFKLQKLHLVRNYQ